MHVYRCEYEDQDEGEEEKNVEYQIWPTYSICFMLCLCPLRRGGHQGREFSC